MVLAKALADQLGGEIEDLRKAIETEVRPTVVSGVPYLLRGDAEKAFLGISGKWNGSRSQSTASVPSDPPPVPVTKVPPNVSGTQAVDALILKTITTLSGAGKEAVGMKAIRQVVRWDYSKVYTSLLRLARNGRVEKKVAPAADAIGETAFYIPTGKVVTVEVKPAKIPTCAKSFAEVWALIGTPVQGVSTHPTHCRIPEFAEAVAGTVGSTPRKVNDRIRERIGRDVIHSILVKGTRYISADTALGLYNYWTKQNESLPKPAPAPVEVKDLDPIVKAVAELETRGPVNRNRIGSKLGVPQGQLELLLEDCIRQGVLTRHREGQEWRYSTPPKPPTPTILPDIPGLEPKLRDVLFVVKNLGVNATTKTIAQAIGVIPWTAGERIRACIARDYLKRVDKTHVVLTPKGLGTDQTPKTETIGSLQSLVDAVKASGGTATYTQICRHLGMPRHSVRNRVSRAIAAGVVVKVQKCDKHTGDEAIIGLPGAPTSVPPTVDEICDRVLTLVQQDTLNAVRKFNRPVGYRNIASALGISPEAVKARFGTLLAIKELVKLPDLDPSGYALFDIPGRKPTPVPDHPEPPLGSTVYTMSAGGGTVTLSLPAGLKPQQVEIVRAWIQMVMDSHS